MNYLKKIGFSLLYIISSILILTIFITLLSYFNIINNSVTSILKILVLVISIIIGGYYIGKRSTKKGYIEGLKLGTIFSILLLIFNYLAFNSGFKIKYLMLYLIIIVSSILGSMIGINKKIKTN